MDERTLIERISNGDHNAFRELIREHESRVASTVYGMLGDCPEAEDVGQETFIRFYRSLDSFRGDASIATYLTRIAVNLSINELKRRKRKKIIFQKDVEGIENIADRESNRLLENDRQVLMKALNKLPDKFRAVIVLRMIDEYSTDETAQILKIPAGTVLSRLSRGLEKMKLMLSQALGGLND